MRLQQGKEENGNSIMLFMNLQVSLGKEDKFPFYVVLKLVHTCILRRTRFNFHHELEFHANPQGVCPSSFD